MIHIVHFVSLRLIISCIVAHYAAYLSYMRPYNEPQRHEVKQNGNKQQT